MSRERVLYLFVSIFIALAFILLIYRAYIIQIVRHEKLQKYSTYDEVIKVIKGKRGSIFDKNGEELAASEAKIDIAVDPKGIVRKDDMAVILAEILGKDVKKIYKILKRKGRFYYLKKDASFDTVRRLKSYKSKLRKEVRELKKDRDKNTDEIDKLTDIVKGFNFVIYYEGYKRVYPQGTLLANVLGFVQRNEDKGLEGIEMSYDKFLVGNERKIRRLTIPSTGQSTLEIEKEIKENPSSDVYLTVDGRMQYIAEEELAKMMEKSKAKWGGVVIMDPASGKILAMANNPTFDPSAYYKYSAAKRRNYAVANLFEPGSTFKVFSIVGVINENLVKPGELIFGENGRFMFGKRWVRDSHDHKWMTVRDVVVNSSNIGTIKLADRLTSKQLYGYFKDFGFGSKTKINLPGESSRPVRDYKKWYPIDKGNISFGQGISVNMVQLVRAYSSIYNGGILWQPTIVDKIVNPETGKIVFQTVPEPKRIKFHYNSNRRMIKMLEGVVEEGTAKSARLKGVKVGGKTGTSQIFDFEKKKYSWSKVVCSFVGAVPSNDPEFVMMVVIKEPQGREFGGTVAAPVFRNIAKRILPMRGILVEAEEDDVSVIPEFLSVDVTGSVVEKKEGASVSPLDYIKIPDFTHMKIIQAVRLANKSGLDVMMSGDSKGRISSQYPAAGEFVPFGTVVTIEIEETLNEEE